MTVSRLMAVAAGVIAGVAMVAVPASAQEAAKPKVVSHDLAGREQCLMCHTAGVMEAVPDAPAATHKDRVNESCMLCHAKESPIQTADPPAIAHDLAGREQCLMCHKAGVMEAVPDVPANHGDTKQEFCGLCHKPAG